MDSIHKPLALPRCDRVRAIAIHSVVAPEDLRSTGPIGIGLGLEVVGLAFEHLVAVGRAAVGGDGGVPGVVGEVLAGFADGVVCGRVC